MDGSGEPDRRRDGHRLGRAIFWILVLAVVATLAYVGYRFLDSRDPSLAAVALPGLASLLVAYFTKELYDVNTRLWELETHREEARFTIRRVGWPPEGGWIEFDVENRGGQDAAIGSVQARFPSMEGQIHAEARALCPRDDARSGFDPIMVESGARVPVRAGEWEHVGGPEVDHVFQGLKTTEDGSLQVDPVIQRTEDSPGSIELPPPGHERVEPS